MIRFYFNLAPNPMKIALMLEELGLAYEAMAVDTAKGEQHSPAFRAINPNGKVPAIVDTEGPGGREARVFDSSAILPSMYWFDFSYCYGGSRARGGELRPRRVCRRRLSICASSMLRWPMSHMTAKPPARLSHVPPG